MKLYGDPKRIRIRGELSKRFYVRVYDCETRKRVFRCTGKTSMKAALAQKKEWELEDAQGKSKAEKVSITDAVKAWLEVKGAELTEEGLAGYKGYSEGWKESFSERALVRSLSPAAVEKHFRQRSVEVGASTLNRERMALRQFCTWCRLRGWIDTDPTATVRRAREERRDIRALTAAEEKKLLRACRQPFTQERTALRNIGGRGRRKRSKKKATWKQKRQPPRWLEPLVRLGLGTGLRLGNLLGLTWREVDFSRKCISISPEKMKMGEGLTVPLSDETLDLLRKLKAEADSIYVVGVRNRANVRRSFKAAVERAGLPQTRFHDLRSTHLSRCRRAGIDVEIVARLAGHRDIRTTLKFYRRVEESELREAVEKLAAANRQAAQEAQQEGGTA